MQELLQQPLAYRGTILWLILLVTWIAGTVVVARPVMRQQRTFYEHFQWFDRGMVLWRRQADPELEQLRREVWRRWGYAALWGVGFPLLAMGLLALLP